MEKYDVVIIGAGPAGLFAAYELRKNTNIKVCVVEQGNDIYKRKCPIDGNNIKQCINCNPCSIMRGFGGAGAFSDGKYNFTTQYGGWLNEYIGDEEVMKLIRYIDVINVDLIKENDSNAYIPRKFSSDTNKWKEKCLAHDLHLLDGQVRHWGTELNLLILKQMYEKLKSMQVEFKFNTKVEEFNKNINFETKCSNGETLYSEYLICSPGRSGSEWFSKQCERLNLKMTNNQVDIGVRVEVPNEIISHITDDIYELKVKYRSKGYEDIIRTFCMNPGGHVVAENVDGIVTVNGHSFDDLALRSRNTNFALLVSNKFTEPFDEPHKYGKSIASFSNMLGGGIIVQRFGDLIKHRRTDQSRLNKSFTKPTLNATPGDLSLVLPKRHLDNIIEMINQLNEICPGINSPDTLLYGVEVKFYSSRIELDNNLQTIINKMYAIGDGCGVTRGLSQASASGVLVAKEIKDRIKGNE